MNLKVLLSIALVAITGTLVFAGEARADFVNCPGSNSVTGYGPTTWTGQSLTIQVNFTATGPGYIAGRCDPNPVVANCDLQVDGVSYTPTCSNTGFYPGCNTAPTCIYTLTQSVNFASGGAHNVHADAAVYWGCCGGSHGNIYSTGQTWTLTTPATPPTPPVSPSASAGPSSGQTTVTWQTPTANGGASITQYTVLRGTSSGGPYSTAGTSTTLSFTDTGLALGTPYFYVVQAQNSAGTGGMSPETSATTWNTPGAPQTSAIAEVANTHLYLTWQTPTTDGAQTITGYAILRSTTSGTEAAYDTVGVVLGYNDSSVTPGSTYYYTVKAINSVGAGAASQEVNTKFIVPPAAPQTPSSTEITFNHIAVSWAAPSTDGGSTITGYDVQRAASAGHETAYAHVASGLSFSDTAVTPGTTYYYTITATNAAGTSAASSETSTFFSIPPTAPRNILSSGTHSITTIGWAAPASNGGTAVTGYTVYKASTPTGTFNSLGTTASLFYTDAVAPDGNATYRVTASNAAGESVPSLPTTPALSALSAIPLNAGVELSWDASYSPSGFAISRSTDQVTYTALTTVGSEARTFTDSGLTNGQTYSYKVTRDGNAIGSAALATPDGRNTATSTFSILAGAAGNSGWTRGPATLDFDVNGPTYSGTYHTVASIGGQEAEIAAGSAKYIDEFETTTGWAPCPVGSTSTSPPVGGPCTILSVPTVSSTATAKQGVNALKAVVMNDPGSTGSPNQIDSEPYITKTVSLNLSSYDTIDFWVNYATTSLIGTTGTMDFYLLDNSAGSGTIVFAQPNIALQGGWNHVLFHFGGNGPSNVGKIELLTHEARKNIPANAESQTFIFDGLKVYTTTPFTDSIQGENRWNFVINDSSGYVQETPHFITKIDSVAPFTTLVPTGTKGNLVGATQWWVSPVQVALNEIDNTSGPAQVTYTVAGGSATTYTGPFQVSAQGSTLVTYSGTDIAGNPEPMRSETFAIDTLAPTASLTVSTCPTTTGLNGWCVAPSQTVTTSASDPTPGSGSPTEACTIDGIPIACGTIAVGQGSHSVCDTPTDAAGNRGSATCATVKLDNGPPTGAGAKTGSQGGSAYYIGTVSVSATASDSASGVASITYALDGGAQRAYSTGFPVSADGAHTVVFTITDNAGNLFRPPSIQFTIDSTPPVTLAWVNGTGEQQWRSGVVPVDLLPTDPGTGASGPQSGQYRVDNGSWQAMGVVGVEVTLSGNGYHSVDFNSVDIAGNSESTKTVSFTIENFAPRVTFRNPLPNATVSTSQQVVISHNDGDGNINSGIDPALTKLSVWYYPSGQAIGPYVDVTTQGTTTAGESQTVWRDTQIGGMKPGLYEILGSVSDRAGNTSDLGVGGGYFFTVSATA